MSLDRVPRLLVSLLAGAVLMGGVTYGAQSYLPMPSQRTQLVAAPATRMLEVLGDHYISELDDKKLIMSAFKGVQKYRKSKKLAPLKLPDIPEGARRDQMLGFLETFVAEAQRDQTPSGQEASSSSPSPTPGKTPIPEASPAGQPRESSKLTEALAYRYAALSGMAEGLDDPYSVVFTPRDYQAFTKQLDGENFGGIGVYMEADRLHNGRLTVAEPIEGTPAFEAGIEEGDVLEKIDGEATAGWPIEKAISKIRGPEGTPVLLGIYRPGPPEKHLELSVKRAKIQSRSVSSKLLDGKIGYIRLRIYSEDTGTEFEQELRKMKRKGAKALILDLRNNGGGYIKAAISVCSHFLPKGENIVSVVNPRTGRNDLSPSAGVDLVDMPTIVLVNRFSASASEITAGALQDTKKAKLLGEKTFGKASVQQMEQFPDGGAFKYTIAHYLTPTGRDIHRKGIDVDFKVPFEPESKDDNVLEAAKKELFKSGI